MIPLIVLLCTILLSLIIGRIAAVALTFTGLSREMASFQARSALTTTGFATLEAESVMNHPVRRRIISMLMLCGNAGLVVVIATIIASITVETHIPWLTRVGLLAGGLTVLWIFATSAWIDDRLSRLIGWALRRFTYLEVHDFLDLLQLGHGYSVTKLLVEPEDWIIGRRLDALRLTTLGIHVLVIRRAHGELVGNPTGMTTIRKGDGIILYGQREDILALDRRRGTPEGMAEYFQVLDARVEAEAREHDAAGTAS